MTIAIIIAVICLILLLFDTWLQFYYIKETLKKIVAATKIIIAVIISKFMCNDNTSNDE